MERALQESTRSLFADLRAKHRAHPEDDLLIVLVDLHGGKPAPQAQPKTPGSAG